jgi:hypothetical protein
MSAISPLIAMFLLAPVWHARLAVHLPLLEANGIIF